MKINLFKKLIVFTLIYLLSIYVIIQNNSYSLSNINTTDNNIDIISNNNSYYDVLAGWLESGFQAPDFFAEITPQLMISESNLVEIKDHQAYQLSKYDSIEIEVDIFEEGLYEIWLDYIVIGKRATNPLLSKEVMQNNSTYQIQYNEDAGIRLNLVWGKETEIPSIDRYGDEIAIRSINQEDWIENYKLFDPASIAKDPLKNHLNQGLNKIKLTLLNTVDISIKSIKVTNSNEIITYQDYLDSHLVNQATRPSNKLIEVNAEDYTLKGNTNITATSIMKPHMSKYQYNKKFINAVTITKAGQWIEYNVNVEESGLYKIGIKAELTNIGLPVFRKILVNGEIPFKDFNHLRINYQQGWSNYVLSNNNEPYEVYLEEGINKIRFEASPGLNNHFRTLQNVLDDIQELNMEITSLTGGINDINRTWKIEQYIPDIKPRLKAMADIIYEQYEELTSYSNKRAAQFNVLRIAANQIMELEETPDELIEKAYLLNVGSSSSASLIAASLTGLLEEPMMMDSLYFFTDVELPKANSSWFKNAFEAIKIFFFSFFDPRYDIDLSDDPEVVKVWVRKSKLHVDLMQRMADEIFTPDTGIEVELIVLQSENRLVLANAAGKTPDVALSVGSVFDYASRGMLADLRILDGFQEAASEFNPNSFVPYIFEDGVYGMPETQDVALMYYRKDILSALDLEVPNTWEEVLGMLPLLQSLGMNFYHPISGQASTKSINHMSPLIYQYGGEFYGETADIINIRDPKTVESIKYMIDLYNIYNLPLQIGSFYERFRNGTLPIGISDQNMYIQLKYAAPEIIGQWGVSPIPGMENEEKIVERWDTALGQSAVIFESSKNKSNAWEFVKWWVSSETQSEFSHELVTNFGDLFLYMTANIVGFETSSWPEDSKDQILEQWGWIRIPPRLPGYYMLERELSNVYNKAVFEQTNYRTALDEAYFNLVREINRKLIEFGYDQNNKYRIPNNNNITDWIGE